MVNKSIPYQSFCWVIGTTSFRTAKLNLKIEEQLLLLDEFYNEVIKESSWNWNNELQEKYYDFMKDRAFLTGEAKRKDKDAREKTSGLVDIGLITEDRLITDAGRELLKITSSGDFETNNVFNINRDSFIYLKQLLKTSIDVSGSIASFDEIRLLGGNEQLLALYNRQDELGDRIDSWTDLAWHIAKRWPNWTVLKRLMAHASGLQDAEVILAQAKTIEQQRQLLEEPDPVGPLIVGLTQRLRDELNRLDGEYASRHEEGLKRLAADSNWQQLEPEQHDQLMSAQFLHDSARPEVKVQSTNDVLTTLDNCTLSMFADRVAAMPARFENVASAVAELCEPKAQFIQVPRRTLKTVDEIDAWVVEVKEQLKTALQNGPIVIR